MMLDHIRLLARNNAWANGTLYHAVQTLTEDQLHVRYASFFGTIPRTLNHIYEVDLFYIDGLMNEGRGRAVYQRPDIDDMALLCAAQGASDERLIAFCDTLSETQAAQLCALERKNAMSHERVDHTLLHLFQHQVHHRGQVHGMLSQAGANPPQLDDFFLEFGRVASAKPYWEDV